MQSWDTRRPCDLNFLGTGYCLTHLARDWEWTAAVCYQMGMVCEMWAGVECVSWLCEWGGGVSNAFNASFCCIASSFSVCVCGLFGVPYDQLSKEENDLSLVYRWVCVICWLSLKSRHYSTKAPLKINHTWQWWRRIPTVGKLWAVYFVVCYSWSGRWPERKT